MSCVFREKSKTENTKRKLVGVCRGEKCVFGMKGKRKNTCRVFLGRKASGKTQTGSLSLGCGEKSGRGRKKVSRKTRDVGAGGEKQAGKPTPEAYR